MSIVPEMTTPERPELKAVVLAGGRGTRLAPYTSVLPKPLMPIGDRTVLEFVIEHLVRCGLREIALSVGHLSHLIRAVFEDGSKWGARIDYVEEDEPLGTASPLSLVPGLDRTFLVTNGDVLTTLDFRELARHHRKHRNIFTIATTPRRTTLDYGVLHVENESRGLRLVGYEEKPVVDSRVSMGIYVLEPEALDAIPRGERFDIPDLVLELLRRGERVGAYHFEGFWLDIGRHEDYESAVSAREQNPDFPFSAETPGARGLRG